MGFPKSVGGFKDERLSICPLYFSMLLNMVFVVFLYFSVLSKMYTMSICCFITFKVLSVAEFLSFYSPFSAWKQILAHCVGGWMESMSPTQSLNSSWEVENALCKHPIVKESYLKVMFKSCFKCLIKSFIFFILESGW